MDDVDLGSGEEEQGRAQLRVKTRKNSLLIDAESGSLTNSILVSGATLRKRTKKDMFIDAK